MCQFRLTVPRIRHLKCDEEKPVCRRCRDDNRTCDGYQHATERARERRRMRHPGGRVGQPNSQRAVIQVFPSALWDISGQELGRSSFYHVISCTLKDCGSSAFISRFWLEHVLPLGHYVEPIKYGLMALGSAHRSFLKNHVRNMYVSDNQWDDHVATVQYNIAIRHVTQVISSPSPASIEITLICCLIFTCFDTMQGNYDRALQHLRAGSTILYFLGTSSENSSNLNRLYDIAGVFSRFGVDMSLLIEDQITRDLSFYTRYTTRDSVARPFSSVLEVQEELHIVELAFGMGDDNDQDPSLVGSCSEWQTAVDGFEYWSKGLDLYQCSLTEKESTDQEMHKLVILSFHQKVWSVIIKQNPECEIITPEQEDLNDIISFAEQHVFPSLPATTHSIFALDASIIPPLAFVCGFSKEPSLIQRAIKLLRSLNRRELMWDSSEIADIYEAVLLAKSQNMWDEEYCQLSIPELARKLVCLGFLERNFTSTVVSQIN